MVPIESAVGPAAVEYPYAHNGFPPQQRQFSAFTPPSAAGPHSHEPPERVHSSAQIPLAMGKAGGPRKRAVVVGCCYPRNVDIRLNGCANDAQVFALSLVHLLQFAPHNVVLLTDVYPNSCYRSKPRHRPHEMELAPDLQDDPLRLPTRQNILLGLNWLRSNAAAGDALVFFFAGHGIQIDNMSGWEGEGYDEGILPCDFNETDCGVPNILTASIIKQVLVGGSAQAQLSIFLDCNGGQTMLDPAGTGSWRYIRGIKQKGVWPFLTDPTSKVNRAKYDSSVWMSERMRMRHARPRFVPGIDVDNTANLADPALQGASAHPIRCRAFLLAAAPWGQCAVEALFSSIAIRPLGKKKPVTAPGASVIHGVFTRCVVLCLHQLMVAKGGATYRELVQRVADLIRSLKLFEGLPNLDQAPEATFHTGGGCALEDLICRPVVQRAETPPPLRRSQGA
eukprot:Polyplicarium_translucidae@DN2280_c0_g1_i5.p1